MILPWKNYLETNEVSLVLPNGDKYIAYPTQELEEDYVLKISDGNEIKLERVDWEQEKVNISNQYSDIYGVYEPTDINGIEPDDEKQCFFGKTPEGLYLDRLQRPEYVMDHQSTNQFYMKDNWGVLHSPDNGKTIFKTEWCRRLSMFYNCMKCDVFPDNPGWKKISKEEAVESILSIEGPTGRARNIIEKINNETLDSPFQSEDSILDNWILP